MGTTIDECVKALKGSTMFHMSLGSKELFHSNFLHWISIVNWDAFLKIMHGLAGLKEDETFWWEDHKCLVEGYKEKYHPDNNNLEVLREHKSFDLSIYILVEKTKRGEKKETQKWIPVLVLENKVKSIPHLEQLKKYQEKAKKEWRKKDCKEGRYISFILLSLWRDLPEDILPAERIISIGPECRWAKNFYKDLFDLLSNDSIVSSFKNLNKDIIIDYTKFIFSLDNLANNDWIITVERLWGAIYPWKEREYEDDPYVKLRIHDLWEKIHYEQLLKFLMEKLESKKIKITQDKDEYQKQKDGSIVLCSSGYAHNIGLFEAWIKNGDDDYIIQVQGDSYHRGYLCGKGTNLDELKDCYFQRGMCQLDFKYKENYSLYSFNVSNRNKVLYYTKAVITSETKISKIIEVMYDDITHLIKNKNTTTLNFSHKVTIL